jgi:hypothetical protein
MATQPEVKTEIARQISKLTDMQRKVMLGKFPRYYSRWWAPIGWLKGRGLIEAKNNHDDAIPSQIWNLTPLGREVRAALEAEQ